MWTLANQITMARTTIVLLIPFLIYSDSKLLRIIAAALAIVIVSMDWWDGFLARRYKQESDFGSIMDIAGDRITENVFWIIFAHQHLIPLWIPIVVMARGFITDLFRTYAFKLSYTPFGSKTFQQSPLARFLTGHYFTRALIGVMKAITFTWLTVFSALFYQETSIPLWAIQFHKIGIMLAIATTAITIVRGIPVIIEGYWLVRDN